MNAAPDQRAGRWSRRREERPGEIVAAALALFAERGFAATKLEDVARRAGISKGAIYLYFATKEDVFQAVVRQEIVPILEQFGVFGSTSDLSSADLLRMILGRMAAVMETDVGAIPKLIMAEAGNFPAIAKFYADEVVGRAFAIVGGILQRGVSRGEFRPIATAEFMPIFVGPLLLTLLWRHSVGPHAQIQFDQQAVVRAQLDILLRGLAPDKPAAK